MNKQRIQEITTIGILTALSVVLFSLIRIPLFGNIKLDLSYIVLAVAIVKCQMAGAIFVGGVGALLESILFAVNGLSISWVIGNVIIAIISKLAYELSIKQNKNWLFIAGLILGGFIGLVVVKTIIESLLFDIPLILRIPNNVVAFISDLICMFIGVIVAKRID